MKKNGNKLEKRVRYYNTEKRSLKFLLPFLLRLFPTRAQRVATPSMYGINPSKVVLVSIHM